jgi:hypothetical protein
MKQFIRCLLLLVCGLLYSLNAARGQKTDLKTINDSVFIAGDCIRLPVGDDAAMQHTAAFLLRHPELFFRVTVYHEQKSKDSLLFAARMKNAQTIYDTLVRKGVPFFRLSWTVTRASVQKAATPPVLELIRITRTMHDTVYNPGDCIPFNGIMDNEGTRTRPEAKDTLEALLQFVKKHPELTFEIASHTDSRGSDKFNEKLSLSRAGVIRDYLLQRGVYPPAVIARGYGENELLFPDPAIYARKTKQETELLHQQNRRTEIRILTNAGRH